MNRAEIARLLELVRQYDQRGITADDITAWHGTLSALPFKAAEEAVHIHHKTSGAAVTAAALLDIATQIETRTTSAPRPARRARMGTYTVTGALNHPCERCGAVAGETCTNADGHETAAPCVSRLIGRPINEAKPAGHRGRAA